jgi:ABC-type uncharacterized transport system permease subunit
MADIVIQHLPHLLAALLYGGLGLHFWHSRWREGGKQHGQAGVAVPMLAWERAAIAGALVIHAWGLYVGLFTEDRMRFSFSFALSLMMWLAVLIYWLESFMARMEGLQPMVLPLAAVCAFLPVLFPYVHVVANAGATGFKLHFLVAMLAYSLLTLSALHAIFMGLVENALHRHSLKRSLASLPPLMAMESLLFHMLTIGFILLTLTVGSGVFFSKILFDKPFTLNHMTLFGFASWGIFATLLVGRHAWGWRGKRALRWTLAGFSLLILAYVGSRFVGEVILHRL